MTWPLPLRPVHCYTLRLPPTTLTLLRLLWIRYRTRGCAPPPFLTDLPTPHYAYTMRDAFTRFMTQRTLHAYNGVLHGVFCHTPHTLHLNPPWILTLDSSATHTLDDLTTAPLTRVTPHTFNTPGFARFYRAAIPLHYGACV